MTGRRCFSIATGSARAVSINVLHVGDTAPVPGSRQPSLHRGLPQDAAMKLTTFQVLNFRSINDSGPVSVAALTSLVGRNESGKSNLLLALRTLNPPRGLRDLTPIKEFPRHRRLSECKDDTPVVRTVWELNGGEQARTRSCHQRRRSASSACSRESARRTRRSRQGPADRSVEACAPASFCPALAGYLAIGVACRRLAAYTLIDPVPSSLVETDARHRCRSPGAATLARSWPRRRAGPGARYPYAG